MAVFRSGKVTDAKACAPRRDRPRIRRCARLTPHMHIAPPLECDKKPS